MSSELIPFQFDSHEIRTLAIDGLPYFVAKDVAEALGYAKPENAVVRHCKGVTETRTPSKGGMQTVKIIPEPDLYRLIMRSKLPTAEKFEEWVVGEVLPSIRRTGSYEHGQPSQPALPASTPADNNPQLYC